MKKLLFVPLALWLMLAGCSPIENTARDTAATLGGLLVAAQQQHQECKSDAAQPVCQLISKGISGQNALITATETYCGWDPASPPADAHAKCVPVKSAEAGLQTAITNANQLLTEIKGVLK